MSEKKQVALAIELRDEINKVSGELIDRSHRKHLGASEIGHECERYLWFKFHWFKPSLFVDYHTGEDVSGRMLRLFKRGHDEESKLVDWLKAVGAKVWEFDELQGEQKQFRITGVNGHFGGSLDGIVLIERWFDDYMLLEMKTYNRKRFAELKLRGVFAADPKYFTQIVVYGREYKLNFCLFIAACKDDDDIYIEIVNLSTGIDYANEAFAKADRIINSPTAPTRLSNTPTFYKCKTCEFKGVCHNDEPADISCRSCKSAQPVADKRWFCHVHQALIPDNDDDATIKAACGHWEQIK